MKSTVLKCECGSFDHSIRITYDTEWKEFIIEGILHPYGFFERIVNAWKYVFNYKRQGSIIETLVNEEDFISGLEELL